MTGAEFIKDDCMSLFHSIAFASRLPLPLNLGHVLLAEHTMDNMLICALSPGCCYHYQLGRRDGRIAEQYVSQPPIRNPLILA